MKNAAAWLMLTVSVFVSFLLVALGLLGQFEYLQGVASSGLLLIALSLVLVGRQWPPLARFTCCTLACVAITLVSYFPHFITDFQQTTDLQIGLVQAWMLGTVILSLTSVQVLPWWARLQLFIAFPVALLFSIAANLFMERQGYVVNLSAYIDNADSEDLHMLGGMFFLPWAIMAAVLMQNLAKVPLEDTQVKAFTHMNKKKAFTRKAEEECGPITRPNS